MITSDAARIQRTVDLLTARITKVEAIPAGKISPTLDDETARGTYDVGSVPELDGRLFRIPSGGSNPAVIAHRMNRVPIAFLLAKSDKDCRIWQANVTRTGFDLHRSDATAEVEVLAI